MAKDLSELMATTIEPWKHYELSAYDLLRSTGYLCQRDLVVRGVRGTHQIDIVVSLNVLIGNYRWLVECKHWSRPVGKKELLAFKTIIDDVGADHGFLLSENGFQKGARGMAHTLNISLYSLPELSDHFVQEQLDLQHRQSEEFRVTVVHEEDIGNLDSEAIIELIPVNNLSIEAYIIEIHIIRDGVFNCIIPKEVALKRITAEGVLRISLPWDLPRLCGVELASPFWGKTKEGMSLDGSYRVVFRTLAGPVALETYVPTFK